MIFSGEFAPGIDLVDVCLWLFTLFFVGLIFWLDRESHREGFPPVSDETGEVENGGVVFMPTAKTYILSHGRENVTVPPGEGDQREIALRRLAPWAGTPYEPTGDPMADGVGPASYAERQDVPDILANGDTRIIPYSTDAAYSVAPNDLDPRGLDVIGADGEKGGVVVDLWVDRAEAIIRYYEVNAGTDEVPHHVLLPVPFADVKKKERQVHVDALFGHHFAKVPTTKNPTSVTRLEEDKITGFYGGGKFYAEASRHEPYI
ncbi:MAG: photosynthetic reaction center subunit H [Parvularculaceae bacterium]|nr:photosynthetic reaction center subunit H [Parvularculaceae bacterium]